MDIKVKNWWYHLRGSFWFIPALMAVSAMILSVVTTAVDRMIPRYFDLHRWWLYGSDPEGARTVLSVISSSMITVAGVVFSITIVVLT